MVSKRDEFTPTTRQKAAQRVGYLCSCPWCRKLTTGPSKEGDDKISSVGEAAHICAAAPGGPRFDPNMTPKERKSINNCIWLCKTHARLIDTDATSFTVEVLRTWKKDAEEYASKSLKNGTFPHSGTNVQLPIILTKTAVPNVTSETVLFRDTDLQLLLEHLNTKHTKTLLIHGFGGVGKTSLARLLYSRVRNSYKSVGWIEYHIDIKNSVVEDMELPNLNGDVLEGNESIEHKWLTISYIMNNTREKKLLIVDNVDVDDEINQNPLLDAGLAEISGWTNTDVVITSRLPQINGYYSIPLDNLGDKNNTKNCVNLFYHYNKEACSERDKNEIIIEKIVELAGFNTMIIELLAKSSIYEDSMEAFYKKLKSVGFSYSTLPVITMRVPEPASTIKQIAKLFGLRKRKLIERLIIISFRLIPEGEKVSCFELNNWLGYKTEDIDQLVKEGWIGFNNGFFSIHPLIRQSVTLTDEILKNYRFEIQQKNDTNTTIEGLLEKKKLFGENEPLNVRLRKLIFIDGLLYPYDHISLESVIYVGDNARRMGRRDLAVKYYKMGYERYCADGFLTRKGTEVVNNKPELAWKAIYYYGYLLSYTQNGMSKAEQIVREALKMAELLKDKYNDERSIMLLAASNDHLGYILFHNYNNDINRFIEAKYRLQEALAQRVFLCNSYPDNYRYMHDLAWSQDNLGCLLTKIDDAFLERLQSDKSIGLDETDIQALLNDRIKAEEYLKSALKTRELLADGRGNRNSSSEVAWTNCNLGICVSQNPNRLDEADDYFKEAIRIYRNLGTIIPGKEVSSLARTYAAYARALMKDVNRKSDCLGCFQISLDYNQRLEEKYPGVYTAEINNIINEIKTIRCYEKCWREGDSL